jgi:hypothetical protein
MPDLVNGGVEGEPSTQVTDPAQDSAQNVDSTPDTQAQAQTQQQQQQDQYQQRMNWLQNAYSDQARANEEMRQMLEKYETSSMNDEEKARYELDKRARDLQVREQQLAQTRYANELYSYYSQFVPADKIVGNDPADWQHSVLTTMQSEISTLRKQVAALKGTAKPGTNAPKVGTGGGQGTQGAQKSIWNMTAQERAELMDRIRLGDVRLEDFPSVG